MNVIPPKVLKPSPNVILNIALIQSQQCKFYMFMVKLPIIMTQFMSIIIQTQNILNSQIILIFNGAVLMVSNQNFVRTPEPFALYFLGWLFRIEVRDHFMTLEEVLLH